MIVNFTCLAAHIHCPGGGWLEAAWECACSLLQTTHARLLSHRHDIVSTSSCDHPSSLIAFGVGWLCIKVGWASGAESCGASMSETCLKIKGCEYESLLFY